MGHWYGESGKPQYTVIGANGKERDTTLRDARKLGLVPSVTTIIAGADKPALVMYRERQLLDACIKRPYDFSDNEKEYRQHIAQESRLHSAKAAKAGTTIHDALEQFYLGYYDKASFKDGLGAIINPVIELLDREFPNVEWTPERSFSHHLGFGGKVDMSADGIILDFKTKDTDDIDKMVMYDEHIMQLAAYREGLGMPEAKCYNLFISTQVPGLIKLSEWTEEEAKKGARMFHHLLGFWQEKNNYVPGRIL